MRKGYVCKEGRQQFELGLPSLLFDFRVFDRLFLFGRLSSGSPSTLYIPQQHLNRDPTQPCINIGSQSFILDRQYAPRVVSILQFIGTFTVCQLTPLHLGSHILASLAVSFRLALLYIHPNKTHLILPSSILSQCQAQTPQTPPRRKSTMSVAPKDPPTTIARAETQASVPPAQVIELP